MRWRIRPCQWQLQPLPCITTEGWRDLGDSRIPFPTHTFDQFSLKGWVRWGAHQHDHLAQFVLNNIHVQGVLFGFHLYIYMTFVDARRE